MTLLVFDGDRCLTQSDATIHLTAAAGGVWRLVQVARLVPRVLGDSLYGLVARKRYRWFGRRTTCYVPLRLSNFDSAGASENPQADEGSQTERARRPDGGDGR